MSVEMLVGSSVTGVLVVLTTFVVNPLVLVTSGKVVISSEVLGKDVVTGVDAAEESVVETTDEATLEVAVDTVEVAAVEGAVEITVVATVEACVEITVVTTVEAALEAVVDAICVVICDVIWVVCATDVLASLTINRIRRFCVTHTNIHDDKQLAVLVLLTTQFI